MSGRCADNVRMNKLLLPMLLVGICVAAPSEAAARTKLKLSSMTANGQTVKNLRCTLDRSGFLVAVSVVSALAKHKKAFDRCARRGDAFAVSFTWAGRLTGKIRVPLGGNKRSQKCIARALRKLRPVNSGHCSMILLAGKRKAAERAAVRLMKRMKKARARPRKRK